MGRRSSNYPVELRERAVRMVAEVAPDYPSQWAAITARRQLYFGAAFGCVVAMMIDTAAGRCNDLRNGEEDSDGCPARK